MITAFDGRNQDNQSTFYRSTPHDLPTSEGPPLPSFPSLIWYYQNWKHVPVLGHLYRREIVQLQENIGHYEPISSYINSGLGMDTWTYFFINMSTLLQLIQIIWRSGNNHEYILVDKWFCEFCVVNQSICTRQLHLRTVSVCQYIRKDIELPSHKIYDNGIQALCDQFKNTTYKSKR